MATFELVLLLGAAVLLSSFIDQILPRVSPPLIQILLGVLIALIPTLNLQITLDPELFLVLFIAPLLFYDAKNVDKVGLWKNRKPILSLAVGLVIAIMLVVGFSLHALVPSIPLAAAFALGAALGPTDAVAVSSLSKTAKLGSKEKSLLHGESLINDASGVVSFQFAIAAALTGTYAIAEATVELVISFIGGILLGFILAALTNWLLKKLNSMGLDSTTFHVLFDVMLPFLIYLISEAIGVSGILAVVAAGLLISNYNDNTIGPTSARRSIVTSSVWSVLSFALNGMVFVMLGMQLPGVFQFNWTDTSISSANIILYIAIITALIVGTRFIWLYAMERVRARKVETCSKPRCISSIKSSLISTFGGPKGAVTLSIVFSIPLLMPQGQAFPERDLIIFIASGVILCTLLLANFLLPALSPIPDNEKHDTQTDEEATLGKIAVMQSVIDRLMEARTDENSRATLRVIRAYNARIARVRTESDIDSSEMVALRLGVLEKQKERLQEMEKEHGKNDIAVAESMLRVARAENILRHKRNFGWMVVFGEHHFTVVMRMAWHNIKNVFKRLVGYKPDRMSNDVRIALEQVAVDYLQDLKSDPDSRISKASISEALTQHTSALTALKALEASGPEARTRIANKSIEIERMAYQVELEEIEEFYQNGRISRETAKVMRDNVYLMLVDLEET